MWHHSRLFVLAMAALTATACAAHRGGAGPGVASARSAVAVDRARTRPLGPGPAFRPSALGNPAVAAGLPVGALRCGSAPRGSYGVHIELFAGDHGIVVPAGIGIAPPQRRAGARITGGRCAYPLRTVDPTGVVEIDPRRVPAPTVGDLFELWGQPLSRVRLAGTRATDGRGVVAFVDGRRWPGDPRRIPLRRHVQIVLEVGPLVEPHPSYLFPPAL